MNGICGGTVFFLPDVPTVLGRSAECQVQIADPWISSMHAMFEKRGAELWLVDLESRNGTWVNEQKVREAPLAPGYRLRFGKTEVELRQGLTPRPLQPLLAESGTIVRYLADMQAEERAAREPDPALARRDTDPSSRRTTNRGPGVASPDRHRERHRPGARRRPRPRHGARAHPPHRGHRRAGRALDAPAHGRVGAHAAPRHRAPRAPRRASPRRWSPPRPRGGPACSPSTPSRTCASRGASRSSRRASGPASASRSGPTTASSAWW